MDIVTRLRRQRPDHKRVNGKTVTAYFPVNPDGEEAATLIEALTAALVKADQFMTNGIELGYFRMPTIPDPALATPGIVRSALSLTTPQEKP